MRKLVILRGTPGSGKSYFIKKNGLENFTLSSDELRLLFNSPELTTEYSSIIPQYNNKKVWSLLFYLLEERMKKGEFTIIDAVHASKEDFSEYKKLAEKYRYRLYVIDFTDISRDELYARNEQREEYKVVPRETIDRIIKKMAKESVPSSFKIVKLSDYDSILTTSPRNFDKYKNVHIIGDIHGCFTVLKKYFEENPLVDDELYVFLGDYFDRGIENYETFTFLNDLSEKENTIFLVGNHEDKLYKYACKDEFKMDYDIKNTIAEFEEKGVDKSQIRGFIKKLAQISYMTFRGRTYIISHGGVPYFPKTPIDYVSSNSFIYGIDKYELDIDAIYDRYMKDESEKVYQVHGHRNYEEVEVDKYEYSFNLDGDVENGGCLRILDLLSDGSMEHKLYKNEVFNVNLKEETGVYNLIESMKDSRFVYEKDLGDNVFSFNFTKEAFYNRRWDDVTMRARGLFIDVANYKIVARSYDKFFQIGERQETKIENLKTKFNYPVKCYLKYNGFLGILSVLNGELFFASKSTNVGCYVEYFKDVFYSTFTENQIESIKSKIIEGNVSFVFEVIEPFNDPHIIEYASRKIVLLDIVFNKLNFSKFSYDELREFASENGLEFKKMAYEIDGEETLEKVYSSVTSDDYKNDGEYVEGFVLEDEEGFMVKCKTAYYKKWKYLRSVMEDVVGKNDYSVDTSDKLTLDFVEFLRKKYEGNQVDVEKINIIDERKAFLESNE